MKIIKVLDGIVISDRKAKGQQERTLFIDENIGVEMADLNLSIDPVSVIDSMFDISGNQARANAQYQASETQRYYDNQWRMQQENRRRYEWRKEHDRADTYLQRLVEDAQKAGISPTVALGGSGYSPAMINVPSGQGGRVSGTYQRMSLPEARISASLVNKAKIDELASYHGARGISADADYKRLQAENLRNEFKQKWNRDGTPKMSGRGSLYVPFVDNIDEAKTWYDQGLVPMLNPDMNVELLETVGTGYWLRPRGETFEPAFMNNFTR